MIGVTGAGCAGSSAVPPAAERESRLRQIAADYAQDGDLARAQLELSKLKLANAAQFLVSTAEQDLTDGRSQEDIMQLAALAEALGARSPQIMAYLASVQSTSTPPVEVATEAVTPPLVSSGATATTPPVSDTAADAPTQPALTLPSSPSPAPVVSTPVAPHVIARSTVNLRGGPGTVYPVVGQLVAGQEAGIVGRNASGDWWQVSWNGDPQAWVAGTIVDVMGPIDTVAVPENIPTPPPTFTPAPTVPPATVAPAETPVPSVAYVIKSLRLRPIGVDGQECHGGNYLIIVTVVDAAGNPLDGVRVREIYTGSIQVSGSKGPGTSEWVTGPGGGGMMEVVDDNNNPISEVTRSMSNDWPDFDLMKAAGYCACAPFDDAACQAALVNHTYLFAARHYVYEVVFQRTS